jgi:hypothetical protein
MKLRLKLPVRAAEWSGVLLWLALGSVAVAADSRREWSHRQTVMVEQAGLVEVALPPATTEVARVDLGDLRLDDASGREVAYVVERGEMTPAELFRPGRWTVQVREDHTVLQLELPRGRVAQRVGLETPASAGGIG